MAWDLIEKADRNDADTARMIHAAHAAAFHWSCVGTTINELRAECLLATAYYVAGRAEAAVVHGERCLTLVREVGDAATAFDRASAFASAAAAFSAVDRIDEAAGLLADARAAAERFDRPDDRAVFERFYPAALAADSSKEPS